MERKYKRYRIAVIIISLLLILSISLNFYLYFGCESPQPLLWLQSEEFVDDTILGILRNSEEFREGEDVVFSYDFDNESYSSLLETYHLRDIAGNGSEFVKAKNLMHEYSGRIRHNSTVAITPENMNADYLMKTYLDNKKEGTYCRAKAQILNEMCLALGIYARKLWVLPLSRLDDEYHVVNEVWDSQYNKWIMLDFTNDLYWVDENAEPLSMLEVRDKIINNEFCTPVPSDSDLNDLEKIRKSSAYTFAYYVKNLARLQYMDTYTTGETKVYTLMPVNYTDKKDRDLISRKSVEASPV